MGQLHKSAVVALLVSIASLSEADETVRPEETRSEANLTFPADGRHLLMEASEITGWRSVDRPTRGQGARLEKATYRAWRLYGDGRLEMESPEGKDGVYEIGPAAVEQLLRTLDQVLDLPAAQTTDPNPEHGAFVAVHLSHYATADWQVAIHYLDAMVTEGLDLIFEELAAIALWGTLQDPRPTWVSGNPEPIICRPEYRTSQGLYGPTTEWCAFLLTQSITWQSEGHDVEAVERSREEVRERLRKRLEALPRGLCCGARVP